MLMLGGVGRHVTGLMHRMGLHRVMLVRGAMFLLCGLMDMCGSRSGRVHEA